MSAGGRAAYLRKWREAAPGEVLQGRVMCEARLLREAKLNAAEIQSLREALPGIAEAGAEPFETLTGDFEPQPYQFAGPVGIAPKVDGVLYTLVTHWSSPEKCHAWKESASYLALERLGKVTSEVFMPLSEAYPRDRLREDKLQRQWTLDGHN